MLISIITPFYNVESYIIKSLTSALNQSYNNIEIILVDDASTDSSLAVVHKILDESEHGKCVKIISHEHNRGVAAARNTGIENSTGDYIYFLDSDDELPVNAISDLVSVAENGNSDIIIGDYDVLGGNKSDYISIDSTTDNVLGSQKVLNSFLLRNWNDGTCNKLVSLKLIDKYHIRFQEGIVHEDVLWSFEISLHAQSLSYCHKVTYHYYIRSGSITQSMSEKNFNSLVVVLKSMVQTSLSNMLYNTQPELLNYLADLRMYLLKSMIRNHMSSEFIDSRKMEVNSLFDNSCFNIFSRKYSCVSRMKVLLYYMPTSISIFLIRLLISIRK
jgi:glycosyltransferase involved in cell wall biosynthesis